jgi:hypothetical protein
MKAFAFLFSLLLLLSCSNNNLSREKASKIIIEKYNFPIEVFGLWGFGEVGPGLAKNYRGRYYINKEDYYYFLDKGLIDTTVQEFIAPKLFGSFKADSYYTTFSSEGEKVFTFHETPEGNRLYKMDFYKAKLCDIEFGEITGIKLNATEGTAVVDFSWKCANYTEVCDSTITRRLLYIPETDFEFSDREIHNEKINFSLYDDGWRIVE